MRTAMMALVLSVGSLTGAAAPVCGAAFATACCKHCKAGKPCGDSCIARDRECHKGKGCACG